MNTISYCSAIVDGETIEFNKPISIELDALKAIRSEFPEFLEAILIDAKGRKIGAFFPEF